MQDSVDDILDELGQSDTAWQPAQQILTHKRFKRPTQQAPSRDRCGAHYSFDAIEGDDHEHEYDGPYDDFDWHLLQQPIDDRMRQAERGGARLSLAPRMSKHFSNTSPQAEVVYSIRDLEDNDFDTRQSSLNQAACRLEKYAYNGGQRARQQSSDPQTGGSSSPAFQASKRRVDISRGTTHRPYISAEYTNNAERKHTIVQAPVTPPRPSSKQVTLSQVPPVVQGIPLVPVSELPDRFRSVFPFPAFNAVQSKSFDKIYKSDDNFVLASPTGSGKTVILELAICRAVLQNAVGQHKIVYQAPIKALCSERQRDWQRRFSALGLTCAELTGDNDFGDLHNVQQADVIITTPEKWDSITRKWRDHERLLRLIKLFLIDEVHILKENRGATLETVVSRMKTIGTNVRFVALSATVPNLEDVAAWLGKSPSEPYLPASSERFGEEFRPVKLKRHICGYPSNGNDYQFDVQLDSKLPDVISKFSERKPIMIFCFTRNSTISTAKLLAKWWASSRPGHQYWDRPVERTQFQDRDLYECAGSAVAFHHAGLSSDDRLSVEKGYLNGNIKVICCTSTLAIGVNLPCHFAIIKNTMSFTGSGLQEYSDLEIMQMLGRAGRPQFDDNAVAVILTRQTKVQRYEMMVTGQDVLESKLHHGLIDHLNAEIDLGTIKDLGSARQWLAGTFLYVRIKRNPQYYKIEGVVGAQSVDEQLDNICLRTLDLLQKVSLITRDHGIKGTEFGRAMAQYYIQFETMQTFMGIPPKAQISELLSALAQAAEFKEIRFRSGEKALYKNLNQSLQTRFPIPVTLTHPAHKVSLIIQSILGAADIAWGKEISKFRAQYNSEVNMVFKHASRLIKCIIDCQLFLKDSVAANHALMIERSISARVWDDSPVHMKQIPGVGDVSVRKLINANIKTVEELEYTEAHRIEMLLNRKTPFGLKILDHVKKFPKVRVSVGIVSQPPKRNEDGVTVSVKVDLGFLNEKPLNSWNGKSVYVCLLCETSDGRMAHFARISGQKLGKGQSLVFPVLLKGADQSINCYAMCNAIAGTMREASVRPKVPPFMFPPPKPVTQHPPYEQPASNISKRRTDSGNKSSTIANNMDEFGNDGLDDDDLVNASIGDLDFDHIENYANPTGALTRKNTTNNSSARGKARAKSTEDDGSDPKQLKNGRWECNHKCRDKSACKHLCCRDGLDKPPKKPVKKVLTSDTSLSERYKATGGGSKTQMRLKLDASSKRKGSDRVETLDLTSPSKRRKSDKALMGHSDFRGLHQLHTNARIQAPPASVSSVMHKKPAYCYASGESHNLSFLDGNDPIENERPESSDYGDAPFDELVYQSDIVKNAHPEEEWQFQPDDDDMENHNQALEEANIKGPSSHDEPLSSEGMIGLGAHDGLQNAYEIHTADLCALRNMFDIDFEHDVAADNEGGLSLMVVEGTKTEASPRAAENPNRRLSPPAPKDLEIYFPGNTPRSEMSSKAPKIWNEDPVVKDQSHVQQVKENSNGQPPKDSAGRRENAGPFDTKDVSETKEIVPAAFKDLEPWVFAEFGDIIEVVDT